MKLLKLRNKEKEPKAPKPKKEKKEKKPRRRKVERIENINSDRSIRPKGNAGKIVVAAVLWCSLGFLVFRGVVDIVKPDPLQDLQRQTAAFMQEQQEGRSRELELYAFASNFAKEFCTYQPGGLSEYNERIGCYASGVVSLSTNTSLRHTATATYAQAYQLEQYTSDQFNVYVMVSVTYETPVKDKDGNESIEQTQDNSYLKVPVRALEDGGYIVEDFPLFVAAPEVQNIMSQQYTGKEADAQAKAAVQTLLANFLEAYYSQNQTSIDYYLSSQAEGGAFKGLQGRYTLDAVGGVKTYNHPEQPGQYLAVVDFTVTDVNGQPIPQRMNALIQKEGERFYLLDMNTRGVNLKFKSMN